MLEEKDYYGLTFGSTAEATSGSSFFASAFLGAELPLPPFLAGERPNAASDPENTDAMKVGSKSRIFCPLGSLT